MAEEKEVVEVAEKVETNVEQTPKETPEVVESVDKTLLGEEESSVEKVEEKVEEKVAVPEKYEFQVPEGMALDTVLVDKISPVFKDIGLSQDQAQKLVDAYAPYVKTQVEAQQQESLNFLETQKAEWKAETLKYLGGDSKEKLAQSAKFINKFTDSKEEAQQVREMLEVSGLGNYAPMVKMFIKAGKLVIEDNFVEPNKQNSGGEASIDEMYPSMKK
jgi:hypothetical protein